MKRRAVIRLDPTTLEETGYWDSSDDAWQGNSGGDANAICRACHDGIICRESLWTYKEDNIDGEIFSPIPVNGIQRYEISIIGRVRLLHGHITKGGRYTYGYLEFLYVTSLLNAKIGYLTHILVSITFIVNPEPLRFKLVNHKDGVRDNNIVTNLEWTDHVGNIVTLS